MRIIFCGCSFLTRKRKSMLESLAPKSCLNPFQNGFSESPIPSKEVGSKSCAMRIATGCDKLSSLELQKAEWMNKSCGKLLCVTEISEILRYFLIRNVVKVPWEVWEEGVVRVCEAKIFLPRLSIKTLKIYHNKNHQCTIISAAAMYWFDLLPLA